MYAGEDGPSTLYCTVLKSEIHPGQLTLMMLECDPLSPYHDSTHWPRKLRPEQGPSIMILVSGGKRVNRYLLVYRALIGTPSSLLYTIHKITHRWAALFRLYSAGTNGVVCSEVRPEAACVRAMDWLSLD
jgi:hypothetical protein